MITGAEVLKIGQLKKLENRKSLSRKIIRVIEEINFSQD